MSELNDEFRDSIGTITAEGDRKWIFAKKPFGKLYNARTIVSYLYLLVFFALPWIKVNGEPLFMFNLIERKFILFGTIFWPQDFFLFVIAMLTFMVFVVLFTVVFGRLFCGWICPQTIFMEMVFRKIEYWIEGDAEKQKRLNDAEWNKEKVLKRGAKFFAFFGFSFIIAHYFLAYIIGMDAVVQYMSEGLVNHIGTFIPLVVFSFVFFAVYWKFREQACLIVCPYGRLQGVMLDPNSIVVAYDYVRGEPRGKMKRHAEPEKKLGDCIDCMACVKVCPTGIDIRNGTQLECVNCTACIDACDHIMESVHKPTGLIRYASENNIARSEKLKVTPRIIAYSVVLVALVAVLFALMLTRKDVQATVMRAQGMLFQKQEDGRISNLYNIKLINKTRNTLPVELKLIGTDGEIQVVGKPIVMKPESANDAVFFVIMDKQDIPHRKNKIEIGVYSKGEKLDDVNTNFMGPGGH